MDKVTRQCPQTTTFLKRKESRSGIEPRSFRSAYQPNALPLGQTGSPREQLQAYWLQRLNPQPASPVRCVPKTFSLQMFLHARPSSLAALFNGLMIMTLVVISCPSRYLLFACFSFVCWFVSQGGQLTKYSAI